MNIFVKLGNDIVKLWNEYAGLYLNGVWNTISLAVLCTAVGCIITSSTARFTPKQKPALFATVTLIPGSSPR